MDVVSFKVQEEELRAVHGCPVVNIYINGKKLQDLALEVELRFAEADGKPDLAGDYAGLSPEVMEPDCKHFLGDPDIAAFEDGDTVLLGCTCGDPECGPLTARVEVADATVSWAHCRTGQSPWDLGALGPFMFARQQHETAMLGAGGS